MKNRSLTILLGVALVVTIVLVVVFSRTNQVADPKFSVDPVGSPAEYDVLPEDINLEDLDSELNSLDLDGTEDLSELDTIN